MKIVIAPDSFKGSLKAEEVCSAISEGIKKVFPNAEIVAIPLSDGGEGILESLDKVLTLEFITCKVLNPLGKEIIASYGVLKDSETAIIEMAQASGLTLISKEALNPFLTTTYGTGQLIQDAINKGCKKIIIGIGGSATIDGGLGMAQALGFNFFDKNNNLILQPLNNKLIADIVSFSKPNKNFPEIIVACDVNNSLLGEKGAVYTYAEQKGAKKTDLPLLEENLKYFYTQVVKANALIEQAGAGAAGGLGAGLLFFLEAKLIKGIDLILELTNFEEKTKDSKIIFTGEGKIDAQTSYGKVISGILKYTKDKKIPVIALAGSVEQIEELNNLGLTSAFSITNKPMTLDYAIENAFELLVSKTEQICRLLDNEFSCSLSGVETKKN